MPRLRSAVPCLSLALAVLATVAPRIAAQEAATTDEEKVAQALAAAPPDVADGARVLDFPAEPGADFRVLREGANGWTCLPDPPGDANFEPMCNTSAWMKWLEAFMAGESPSPETMGLSYMLTSKWAVSNTNPAATSPEEGEDWHEGGAHLMVVVPDPAMLADFPDDPHAGGAYVMWKGTPYVHLMIPTPEEGGG